jgi:hypothetical protein
MLPLISLEEEMIAQNAVFVKMRLSSDFETVFHFLRPQFFPPKTELITLVLVGTI